MWEYLITNWQPLLLVLSGLIAGTIILNIAEKMFNFFGPNIKKIIFRALFYIVLLSVITRVLNLW
jgi:hypothetical protein